MKNSTLRLLFFYGFAANIPLWIASHTFGLLLRGVFNVEFLLLGILSLFLWRGITVLLLVLLVLIDIVTGVSLTYMLTASETVQSIRWLSEVAASHAPVLIASTLAMALLCFTAASLASGTLGARARLSAAATLAAFTILFAAVDAGTGHIPGLKPDRQLGALRLTRTSTRSLLVMRRQERLLQSQASTGNTGSRVAASHTLVSYTPPPAHALHPSGEQPNIVLVLVESWGKPLADDLNQALLTPYNDNALADLYTVTHGTVPFHGPTVNAESRELCGNAIGFKLLTASPAETKSCLPEQLAASGYSTLALHGFTGRMFDRQRWYRSIGFEDTRFKEQLGSDRLPLCPGPFPGICDASLAAWIGGQLGKDATEPQFIYWVTLASHLPVPIPNAVKNPPSCAYTQPTQRSPALCSWSQLIFNVHRAVAQLALRPTARPTVFLLVGDHAPPFSSSELRSQFSETVVPYVLLTPRSNAAPPSPPTHQAGLFSAHTSSNLQHPHARKAKARSRSTLS